MLLRPTINQLYLLSIAPSNRPPHLKQPPSPNLPFSPSESIHQIIIHQATLVVACPVRVSPPFQSGYLPTHSSAKRTACVCPCPKQGIPQFIMYQFVHFTYAFFNRDTSTNHPPSTACGACPVRVSPPFQSGYLPDHLAAKRTPCVYPCPKQGIPPATATPYLYFLSSTSTILPPNTPRPHLPLPRQSITP